jgi:hypothetical protein
MIHPDIQAMLVRQRSAALLAAAAADRRGRQARSAAMTASRAAASRAAASRAAASTTAGRGQVVRRDGPAVPIRPVRDADAPLLAGGFARLGKRSRRLRFFGRKTTLTEAGPRCYTDADHHDHEPPGALDHVGGDGVGIARYVRDPKNPAA